MDPPASFSNSKASSDEKSEKITELKTQVNTVSAIVYDNIDKMLEREFRLDSIQRRSEELQAASETFKMTARKSQREMWWLNAKWKIISTITVIILVLVVILIILKSVGVI